MRRRAKPGGEVAVGDGEAARKGPRGAQEGRVSGKFSKGTRETSRQRKRGEESDEAIVAGKRGNARGYPPSRRRVAKRCPRGSRRKTAKSVLRVVEDRAGVPHGGVPLYSTPFSYEMVGLHGEIGAARMHELGFGTRGQFASTQAKLIYGSLPEPATPGGATPSETGSN